MLEMRSYLKISALNIPDIQSGMDIDIVPSTVFPMAVLYKLNEPK